MLNREATPGPAGAALDILRVAWGAKQTRAPKAAAVLCTSTGPVWLGAACMACHHDMLPLHARIHGRQQPCAWLLPAKAQQPLALSRCGCCAGTRLMAVLLTSLITPLRVLPLVPHLLLQIYSIAMVRVSKRQARMHTLGLA